ncbi:MAG: 4Fe-4S binding protein [SAR324 cluster bacterium]|nr:4Fe-4S binding protein [SAR324 cluster bacterium]
MFNFKRRHIRKIRYFLQWSICFFVLFGGYRLFLFYEHFVSRTPYVERPQLVDGFLPIGGILSIRFWAENGYIHPVHPAATIILFSALMVSLIFRKSFCGWICPIGALSELVFKLGKRIFGRNFRIHRYLDNSLRSLKYLLLGLVLYLTFVQMNRFAIEVFLGNSYWKVADYKMLLFFMDISRATIIVLTALFVLSLFFKNFWCRYLCPYGGLTGLLGFLSPFQISRNEKTCIQCQKCSQSCPNSLLVDQVAYISSPECNGCLTCISVCPSEKTLEVSFFRRTFIKPIFYFSAVLLVFFGIIAVAQITGNWKSRISYETYSRVVPLAETLSH